MNFDKFTTKSQEIIQEAQTLALANQHQQIEPTHIIWLCWQKMIM